MENNKIRFIEVIVTVLLNSISGLKTFVFNILKTLFLMRKYKF